MKTSRNYLLILLMVSSLISCSTPHKLIIDFNNKIDFTQFNSFHVMVEPPHSPEVLDYNPVISNQISQLIKAELIQKGLVEQSTSADLQVSFRTEHSVKESNSSFSVGIGGGRTSSNRSAGVSLNKTIPIGEGTKYIHIIIDINHNKKAIWHGKDKYESSSSVSSTQENLRIKETVQRLLSYYPPRQEK